MLTIRMKEFVYVRIQIPLGTIFDISFVYNNVPVAEPKPLISQDVHFTIHIK